MLESLRLLLGEIEKLISERGSASVLRERVSLFRDQVEVLEKEIADLEAENATTERRGNQVARRTYEGRGAKGSCRASRRAFPKAGNRKIRGHRLLSSVQNSHGIEYGSHSVLVQ